MNSYTNEWKENFEKTVSFISDKRFFMINEDCVLNKRDLLNRFYGKEKERVKIWITDTGHQTMEDIVSLKLTKEYIQKVIVKYMPLFDKNKNVLEREEFKFCEDGYQWFIRKDFFSHNTITEKDVEYYITASNSRYMTRNVNLKSFMCFIYINSPGYLCYNDKNYKTIENTNYLVLKKYL